MSCPLSSYFDAGTACKYRSKLQKQHQKHQSCLELQDIWVNPVHWTRTSNDPHQAHQVPLLWVLPARTKLWTRDWPATDPALHWHRHHIQAHPRQPLRRLTVDQWTHRDPWSPWSKNPNMVPCWCHVSQTHRLSKYVKMGSSWVMCCPLALSLSSLESWNCLTSGSLEEAIVSYFKFWSILWKLLVHTCAAVCTPTEVWNG